MLSSIFCLALEDVETEEEDEHIDNPTYSVRLDPISDFDQVDDVFEVSIAS